RQHRLESAEVSTRPVLPGEAPLAIGPDAVNRRNGGSIVVQHHPHVRRFRSRCHAPECTRVAVEYPVRRVTFRESLAATNSRTNSVEDLLQSGEGESEDDDFGMEEGLVKANRVRERWR